MSFSKSTRSIGSFRSSLTPNKNDLSNGELALSDEEGNDDIDEIDLGSIDTSSKKITSAKKLPPLQIKSKSFLSAEPILTKRDTLEENNVQLTKKYVSPSILSSGSSISKQSKSSSDKESAKEESVNSQEDETEDNKSIGFSELNKIVDRMTEELEKRLNVYPDYTLSLTNSHNDFNETYFKSIVYDVDNFIQTLPPMHLQVQCKIMVHKSVFNEYFLYMESSSRSSYFLMKATRNKTIKHLKYSIRVSSTSLPHKLGNLQSNISSNSYILTGNYDEENKVFKRKYLDIQFTNKLFDGSKPKDLIAEIALFEKEKSSEKQNPVEDMFHRESKNSMKVMSRKPTFDQKTKTYRLNFQGRVNMPSTNNLQLVDSENPEKILFQLGKSKRNCYICDFSYPFSVFSAFGTAISCLSKK